MAVPAARRGGVDHGTGHLRAAVLHHHPELSLRAFLCPVQGLQPGRIPLHLRGPRFLQGAEKRLHPGLRAGHHRHPAGRHAGLPDDPYRPARPPLDRTADPGAGVRVADGAGLRLRRGRRPRGLLFDLGAEHPGFRALERLFADQHRHHRRPDARAARLPPPASPAPRRCA
ncbi:hypothetical protein G6F57_017426 [Rhizopus arrhizus]|nr:hypothetical protein G6F57_017426 [Rhizopus arrhizus]